MVGDLVSRKGKPVRVLAINEGNGCCVSFGDGWCGEAVELLEPIPLTPEILEKNGFEREKLITLYNHFTGIDNRVSLHDDFMSMNSKNMWSVHIDSEDYCTIASCELTYVHELQHLLKLVKIDFNFVV